MIRVLKTCNVESLDFGVTQCLTDPAELEKIPGKPYADSIDCEQKKHNLSLISEIESE